MNISEKELLRFESKFKKGDGCWEWTGALIKGYGTCRIRKVQRPAHRASFMIYVQDFPKDMHVLHRCDNPKCVRPDHLFLGTRSDNMQDMIAKGRNPKNNGKTLFGSKNGQSKLTEEQVLLIRDIFNTGRARKSTIARMFKICPCHVGHIISRKRWSHI